MHRIDGDGFAPGNLFTDGDPGMGIEATVVTDDWANDVQEELCNVIEATGVTLVKGDQEQLLDAIRYLIPQKVDVNILTDGAGNATVESGYGVTSAAITGTGNGGVRLTLSVEFAARPRVQATVMGVFTAGAANCRFAQSVNTGDSWTTHIDINVRDADGANVNLGTTAVRISIQASGDLV